MSRISGWENLTEGEREKSLRLIAKRNKIRKESLLQAEVEEQSFSSQQQEGNTQNQAQGIDGV
jgi:acyl-CoA reductase-like NAD-dependent aldehyde dehydrogenase